MIQRPQTYFLHSASEGPALRVGLLLDSRHEVPAFAAKIVRDIRASNFAEIVLVIERKDRPVPPAAPLFYDLYLRLDARMKPANDPLAKVDCGNLLAGVESVEVELGKESDSVPAEVIAGICSRNLDVLLQFGFDSLSGAVLKAARYGVWSLYPADTEYDRGGPPHFWEMREQTPLSGVSLCVRSTETSGDLVLCKSRFATEQTISVSRNRFIPYWGSTDLIIQKLHELHESGWDHVRQRAIPPKRDKENRKEYRNPSNTDIVTWLGPVLLKKAISYPFRKETVQHWRIASRINGRSLVDSNSAADFAGFRWLEPPLGHAWADPFVFEHEGKYWAFFEDYSYAKKRAAIACAEISAQGDFGPPMLCLEHPSDHYSYPHVFRAGSEIFMIPESYDSNAVDLYRCERFPNQWVRTAQLLEGKFVDTTVWEHEGLWWLATTSADPVPGAGSLWLYSATSLNGDWNFHPENPISTDIRRSRGAGRVFHNHNRLIRPSQSCAPTYGYSVTFNEITELSKQHYRERPLQTITPEHWEGMAGIHTYNCAGNIELIDGRSPALLKQVASR